MKNINRVQFLPFTKSSNNKQRKLPSHKRGFAASYFAFSVPSDQIPSPVDWVWKYDWSGSMKVLEKEVRFFDQRIALLIKHKISVQEFPDNISFGEHRLGALKDIQKQRFGNLFFLLQTDPKYLPKLTGSVALTEINELLQIVMFSICCDQHEPREEHLLFKMFDKRVRKLVVSQYCYQADDDNIYQTRARAKVSQRDKSISKILFKI